MRERKKGHAPVKIDAQNKVFSPREKSLAPRRLFYVSRIGFGKKEQTALGGPAGLEESLFF
jgi:hypothetical protein